MRYEAALFDLDGTLLNTGKGILASVRQVVEEKGEGPLDESLLRTFVGPPIQNSFARVFNLNKQEAGQWAARFRELYSTQNLLMADSYDGIMSVCAQLKDADVPMAVATYKREDYALDLLKHFGFNQYTDHMFGSDFAGELSKADIIEQALDSMGVPAEKALMVGDTVHDAMGAQQTGIAFLGVSYGYGFRSMADVEGYPCVGMAEKPLQILEYF